MPEGSTATSVTAALLYKSVPDELAEKAGVENPVTQMAVASSAVYANDEAARQAAAPAETSSGSTTPTWVWLAAAGTLAAIGIAFSTWRLRKHA